EPYPVPESGERAVLHHHILLGSDIDADARRGPVLRAEENMAFQVKGDVVGGDGDGGAAGGADQILINVVGARPGDRERAGADALGLGRAGAKPERADGERCPQPAATRQARASQQLTALNQRCDGTVSHFAFSPWYQWMQVWLRVTNVLFSQVLESQL